MQEVVQKIGGILWGNLFMYTIMAIGLYITVRSGFFSFTKFGHIFKNTLGTLKSSKEGSEHQKGTISSFEALCVAVGGCVGVANISGVAAAIAVGGPGALFWLWVWAFFGMTLKCAEVSLGCYYRSKNEKGEFFGGPSYYIQKGMAKVRGWKIGNVLAWLYGIAFCSQFILGSQPFAVSESLQTSFGIPQMATVICYSVILFFVVFKGVSRLAKIFARAVPFMCAAYVFMGVIIILLNIREVPGAFALIFKSAFTGTAAVGGFAGASVKIAMQKGLSRSVNSNEAGQGSSPMIHSSADTVHPIRQGLWGSMEVFVDTMVVCTVTALSILVTGVWDSGLTSVTLATAAFESTYGRLGVVFIGLMMFLFAITSTGGWFTYYISLIYHGVEKNPQVRDAILGVFKCIFPLMPTLFVGMLVYTGFGANMMWDIMDVVCVLPVYVNIICVLLLSGDYFKLLKDYKARYMGIGSIEPNFKYFYDTEPNEAAKQHDAKLLKH